jgi:3-methyladenine DNA glycosylase AlkD
LLAVIRSALVAIGDPDRAARQQIYMKSKMPYHGVTSPELTAVLRPLLNDFNPRDRDEWESVVREIWDDASHREERYAAIALARHRRSRRFQDVETLGLYRHLVVTGAWWDYVDVIAAHLVGGVLASDRDNVPPTLRAWAVGDDIWLRRTAILSQLRHKIHTDTVLLRDVVEANVGESSFWLRKAIGWALREYAYSSPEWVRAEVVRLGDRLAPLSRREALKRIGST